MTSGKRRVPRPPDAVLFDMDGVLVDTFDAWVAVLDACRAHRGLSPLGPGPVRASWGQGILADCRTFFPGETADRLAREYDERFAGHVDRVRAEPGIVDAVHGLRAHGLRTALVTNSPAALARRVLETIGLHEAIPVIAAGDEVARAKPDPDLVHLALSRLGTDPSRSVLVGDTDLDRRAGWAAGVAVIGYRLDADARIDDHADLAAALGLPRS